jgi:hypothetical protein
LKISCFGVDGMNVFRSHELAPFKVVSPVM